MVATDEDALVCDFAETYHIYQWRGLSAKYAAVLAFGLCENSRIKMALSGQKRNFDTMINAATLDAVNLLVWMQTKDGHKNRNRPASLVETLMHEDDKKEPEMMVFDTPADFETMRQAILRGM